MADGRAADGPTAAARRLDEAAVEELLGRFEELVGRVELVPGPTVEAALEAIQALAELYGEALARVVESAGPARTERLAEDPLVGHLLVLHGLHPAPAEDRVARVLADVGAQLGADGDVELTGIDAGVARIRVAAGGCGAGAVAASVADAVLAAAPELVGVEPVTVPPDATPLIPVESLLHRPAVQP